MRLGIKGKQVLGVTLIVGAVVVALSVFFLSMVARQSLDESRARAELLEKAIFHRADEVVREGARPEDLYRALKADSGLRSILASSLYSKNVTYAAVVDLDGVAVVHADSSLEGQMVPPGDRLDSVLSRTALAQLIAIYQGQGRNLEWRQPLLLNGNTDFGSIRIGISTLLIRGDLNASLRPLIATMLGLLAIAVVAASVLSQLLLRPIHVIRSGLTRLGKGELDVRLDLNQQDEFGELGTFFNTVSAQLSADRSQMAGQVANLESAVEHLSDAVAIVSPRGDMLFVNPAMRTLLPKAAAGASLDNLVARDHSLRRLADETAATGQSRGPVSSTFADAGERIIMTHAVNDAQGQLVGVMLVARNLEYLSQVQSTIRYSRKLAALGRLSAGVAHEVKNPLNAMMIHLELLRQQFTARVRPVGAAAGAGRPLTGSGRAEPPGPGVTTVDAVPPIDTAEAMQHVDVIAGEIGRLDEVVQGFLKFTRPEDLKLQPVQLAELMGEIAPVIEPEAQRTGVQVTIECDHAPDVNGDPAMLRQAFLNVALNACHAMPDGGTLRIHCQEARGRRVAVSFTDTGVGIKPEHLQRIFDLYFTTKPKGSGIGLSMVYRTVQMHDGEIEVQSTPGAGTTFRLLLPQA